MSGIIKRTVFYDNTKEIKRFMDWASVATGIGQMAEPFNVNSRVTTATPIIEFDATDQMARIDEIKEVRASALNHRLTGVSTSDIATHGGTQMPRVGV